MSGEDTNFLDKPSVRVVLYEGAGGRPLEGEHRRELLSTLLQAGYPVSRVTADGELASADDSPLIVLGDFDDEKVASAEIEGTKARVAFHDVNGDDVETLVNRVGKFREEVSGPESKPWLPWFPVIDYDRCTNCMQCLSFCLFGVYGVDEEQEIQVQNEDKCKTNCPACSRVCPEVAIMFPKYHASPANGDEVKDEDIHRESMKIDISALLGGNIYEKLRERRDDAKERFARERDDERALAERKRCLSKLSKDMDIPPEVLASLPSPAEIKERAEEAARKASEASLAKRRRDLAGDYSDN